MKTTGYFLFVLLGLLIVNHTQGQGTTGRTTLSAKEQSLVTISALTAKGNMPALKAALNKGLDAGLTVNEIKEELVQLYAYCGFPRSLNGLNTCVVVLDERKKRGINDPTGLEPTSVSGTANKYEQGKKTLETLTGRPEQGPKTGYTAFAPAIDTLLKEHLFADIFGRGVLSHQQRELVTIAALSSLDGLGAQLRGHMTIGLNIGLTKQQLEQVLDLIQTNINLKQADADRKILTSLKSVDK